MTLKQRSLVFKALGHPARLAVVERLGKGECCVCELLEDTEFRKLSAPTVSQHLLVLKNAGVITDEKRGKKIFYQLLMPCVAGISLCVANSRK
jgi:DNA-binding transcriptional ArsR family regulator